jgi:hypothetical protein
MLAPLADNVFSQWFEKPFLGLAFGVRVTIVRLPDGGLWVHSPTPLTPELRSAVEALGPVRHIVAPNLLHYLSVGEWAAAWPDAVVHGPARLPEKQASLTVHRPHEQTPDPAWGGVLEPLTLRGLPQFDETLFVHAPSGTLISADLALAIPAELRHWWTQLYLRMAGIHGQTLGCSLVHKLALKDKPAARASLDAILERDWSRLVLSHSSVVDVPDVKELLASAWSWVPAR